MNVHFNESIITEVLSKYSNINRHTKVFRLALIGVNRKNE